MIAQEYEARGNPRSKGPRGSRAPLTDADIARNKAFLGRVVSIVPQPERKTADPQPAAEPGKVPGLTPNIEYVLGKVTGNAVTPENLRRWCAAHAGDGEGIVLRQSGDFAGVGPVTIDKSLDILAGYGLKRSEEVDASAAVMAALRKLIGEYPTGPAIERWAAAHRTDWKAVLYATFAFGSRVMGGKKLAAVSEVLEAHGCEKARLEPATDFGLSPAARNMLMMMTGVQGWQPSGLRVWSQKGARKALEEILSLLRRLEAEGGQADGRGAPRVNQL